MGFAFSKLGKRKHASTQSTTTAKKEDNSNVGKSCEEKPTNSSDNTRTENTPTKPEIEEVQGVEEIADDESSNENSNSSMGESEEDEESGEDEEEWESEEEEEEVERPHKRSRNAYFVIESDDETDDPTEVKEKNGVRKDVLMQEAATPDTLKDVYKSELAEWLMKREKTKMEGAQQMVQAETIVQIVQQVIDRA